MFIISLMIVSFFMSSCGLSENNARRLINEELSKGSFDKCVFLAYLDISSSQKLNDFLLSKGLISGGSYWSGNTNVKYKNNNTDILCNGDVEVWYSDEAKKKVNRFAYGSLRMQAYLVSIDETLSEGNNVSVVATLRWKLKDSGSPDAKKVVDICCASKQFNEQYNKVSSEKSKITFRFKKYKEGWRLL